MWRKDTIGVVVLALCTCVVAGGQSTRFVQGDIILTDSAEPNDPNTGTAGPGSDPNQAWDPADHFAAVWASVSADLSARIYNPALPPVLWGTRPKRLLSMTAQVTVTDSNGLVGFSRTAAGIHTLDQNGHVIPVSQSDNDSGHLYYWFASRMTQPAPGVGYTIWFDLDSAISQVPYPSLLGRIEWSMYALVTQTFRTVDVPFATSNQWIELVPGLEILVGQTTLVAGKYEYHILARCDPTKVSYVPGRAIYLAPGDLPPEVIVTKIDILDADGNSIPAQGQGTFSSTSGVGTIFTSIPGAAYQGPGGSSTGSGTCPACGTATTIRYTLALKSYEKEVRFVLENVPVPLF
jgi:hypothetical protein